MFADCWVLKGSQRRKRGRKEERQRKKTKKMKKKIRRAKEVEEREEEGMIQDRKDRRKAKYTYDGLVD